MKAQTVYVGMSGGVDSSVTAALLKEQGFTVVGVYLKNWTQDIAGVECPWKADLADARAVAALLDIPLRVFDFQAEYRAQVVDAMVAEYRAGRTPNPDVLCNQHVKFKLFADAAFAAGADLIATGHYARTKDGELLQAKDVAKDQTYFLYRVPGEVLRRTLFPLGNYTKPEVRKLAQTFGLPNAARPDSQGICFVGEVGVKEFLQQYLHAQAGPVVERATGKVIGQHDGAVFYTIGQRHGLGIGGGRPFFVIAKNIETNTVYVTSNADDLALHTSRFELDDVSWITGIAPEAGTGYRVRVRHRGHLIPAALTHTAGGRLEVSLDRPERAIAAGQSAVIYRDDAVLGGGFIAG